MKEDDDGNFASVRIGLRRDAVGEVKLVGRDECLLDEFARQLFAAAGLTAATFSATGLSATGLATTGLTAATFSAARLSATAFSSALSELAELDGLDKALAARG